MRQVAFPRRCVFLASAAAGLLLALAIGVPSAPAAVLDQCMEDRAGFGLTCTANDVEIASITNVHVLDDGCTSQADTVTFDADIELLLNAQERYDIGIYIATDGGDALTGSCLIDIVPIVPNPPFVDLDGGGDLCGDIDQAHSPMFVTLSSITIACTDENGDGVLDLPSCLSWAQGKRDFCATPFEALPGSPSKCNCDRLPILEIPVPPGALEVTKSASPTEVTEPGGTVTFTVSVVNPSPVTVTLSSLVDNVHGNLNGQGTCSVPQTIPAGGTYTCSFSAVVSGAGGSTETDVLTATATDTSGNQLSDADDATVSILDVPSEIRLTKTASPTTVEPGGFVQFSFLIENLSAIDTVTITSLVDSVFGNLDGLGTCSVPRILPPGGTYSCSFTTFVVGLSGEMHTNVATASGIDDDDVPVSDDDSATVTLLDIPSEIQVTKSASPDNLPEPGGPVTFSFTVHNVSQVDTVTITSLVDSIYGDLNGQGTCAVPQTLAPGDSYSCAFTANVNGNAGDVETDVVTASGIDDDGQPVSDDDSATVTLSDVPSEIEVVKSASPNTLPEPGGSVTFSFAVNNLSLVDAVTITSLVDSIYGDLNGQGTCAVPQTIPAGGSYACAFATNVSGNGAQTETDVVVASGSDDDGNPVTDSDSATVMITDVPSSIEVTKTATPEFLLEPGGSVTFSFTVENLSAVDTVTITSLVDSIHGDLNGQGTCAVPQTLAPGASYSCAFTTAVTGNAGAVETDVVTASGTDDDGAPVDDDDAATVTILDVPSMIELTKVAMPNNLPEPGGAVTFFFTVENVSAVDTVTITSLVDSVYGDLNGQGTCAVPQVLAPGASYACSVMVNVSGNAGDTETNVVLGSGTDDDNAPVSDSASETVTITDLPSAMAVIKSATPTQVDEPGGTVTFNVEVNNQSQADAVTVDSLVDSIYGDLNGRGTCAVPQTIPPGGTYSCSFSAGITGPGGHTEVDVVTATGTDDDGNPLSADDDAEVVVRDVPAMIEVLKSADPIEIELPGGPATFTVEVTNTSSLDVVTITGLSDDVYGDIANPLNPALISTTCTVPHVLALGASYTCSFVAQVTGKGLKTDVVTASGTDDDGFPVSDDGDATVLLIGCGDGILQPDRGEECDDGNNQIGDGCTPLCKTEIPTTPVCTHTCASKIVFRPGTKPDRLQIRVGWVPSDPNFDPPLHELGVVLVNSHGVIWEGHLLPGDFVKSGRRWLFKDKTGTLRDGITQAVITFKPDGVWRLDLKAIADLSAADEPVMAVAVLSGNETFVVSASWKQLRNGWRVFFSQ
jgi:uncharacterized repeat protein (TIGR01451 family)